MDSGASDVEILVHVTAPSKASDDAAYRQLARAYLDFEPQTRRTFPPETTLHDDQPAGLLGLSNELPSVPLSTNQESSAPVDDQLYLVESQDLSFEGVADNRMSPKLQATRMGAVQQAAAPSSEPSHDKSQESWCAPASQISDSYPLPDLSIFQVSPTRLLEHYMGRSPSLRRPPASPSPFRQQTDIATATSPTKRGVSIPSSIPVDASYAELLQEAGQAQSAVIPVTPVVFKPVIQKRQLEVNDNEDTVAADVTHISSTDTSRPLASTSFRSESAPPVSKRPRIAAGAVDAVGLARSSSDTGPLRPSSTPILPLHVANALEIRPPSPPPGVDEIEPSSFVSDKLAKLARDLPARYKPEARRKVDSLERGYWLVDCTTWSPDVVNTAWDFLANYLRRGHAGWGVWCRRDPSHQWLRLYCWGQVVEHTYVLLYLASGRHMKRTGAAWHGADGEVALAVPPLDKQS